MYQFTTTNVINSLNVKDYEGNDLLDSAGVAIPAFTGSAAGLSFPKIGFFKKANIVSIYKRPYAAAVKEVAHITIPTIASGLIARLEVVIKLEQSTMSEYTNYSLDFLKPIVVEVIATNSSTADCTALVAQLNALKDRFGSKYFTAVANGSDVEITVKSAEQHIKSMTISKCDPATWLTGNSIIQPIYTDVTNGSFHVATPGSIGFGDDNWMLRRIMLQTLDNVRPFGISKNERPVLGGNYSEYVLRYSLDKDGTDGTVSGSKSVTTHVFYVISTQVTAFEQEITDAGLTVPALIAYTVGDNTLANSATTTSTVTGNVGPVTYSVTSGTSATIHSSTGVVTAHASIDGDTVVRATDSVGNYAEVTITVA